MPTTSWVIREKSTSQVILETFDRAKVDALNTARYEAVPILEYLSSLNSSVIEKAGNEGISPYS